MLLECERRNKADNSVANVQIYKTLIYNMLQTSRITDFYHRLFSTNYLQANTYIQQYKQKQYKQKFNSYKHVVPPKLLQQDCSTDGQ